MVCFEVCRLEVLELVPMPGGDLRRRSRMRGILQGGAVFYRRYRLLIPRESEGCLPDHDILMGNL